MALLRDIPAALPDVETYPAGPLLIHFVSVTGNFPTLTPVQAFNGGYVVVETAEVLNPTVRIYGDAAVVSGVWKAKMTVQGSPVEGRNVLTNTYVKRDGTWKAVASQLTLVK